MQSEELARKAANAVGVTPYSDMRPFVEHAVKWALNEAALSAADPVNHAPICVGEQTIARLRNGLAVEFENGLALIPASDLARSAAEPSVSVKALEWIDDVAEYDDIGLRYILEDGDGLDEEEANGWYALEETTNTVIRADGSPEGAMLAVQADFERRIRSALTAQVQDVVGWQLVPLDDEGRCIADSALPHEMIEAGIRVQEQVNDDNSNYVAGETTDWDCGMVAVAIYRAMLAAAPAKQEG